MEQISGFNRPSAVGPFEEKYAKPCFDNEVSFELTFPCAFHDCSSFILAPAAIPFLFVAGLPRRGEDRGIIESQEGRGERSRQ